MPSAGDKAAEGAALGRLGICMQERLWVKLFGEGDSSRICPDRDSAKAVHVAFNTHNPRSTDRRSDAKMAFRHPLSKRTAVSC